MKIYRLDYNEVADDPQICISSYRAPRTPIKQQYFASKEVALKKQSEIYEGLSKLIGFIPKVEVLITEIEVIE